MASLKIKYRHSSIEGKAGTLFYQVIHNGVARQNPIQDTRFILTSGIFSIPK